jgi:hypothetical protein
MQEVTDQLIERISPTRTFEDICAVIFSSGRSGANVLD